jgi:DNA-directed RNA polymerase specialized sigma24 family protein
VDPRALEASRQIWPWAYRHVEVTLHDAPSAAELLEEVAIEVSARLRAEPEVGRNLKGYLITAFHRRVRLEFLKDSRLAYEGLLQELDGKHHILASDWAPAQEVNIFVDHLTTFMPATAQRIMHYRMLSFSWEEIGEAVGIPIAQARNKYYYGVKIAYERLLTNAAKRRTQEELI